MYIYIYIHIIVYKLICRNGRSGCLGHDGREVEHLGSAKQ